MVYKLNLDDTSSKYFTDRGHEYMFTIYVKHTHPNKTPIILPGNAKAVPVPKRTLKIDDISAELIHTKDLL